MWSKQTDRSALNQNRRQQLSVSQLIPYLGLHKKSWETQRRALSCRLSRAKNGGGKKISLNKKRNKKISTEKTAAPAVSKLIKSKLEGKAKGWDMGASAFSVFVFENLVC